LSLEWNDPDTGKRKSRTAGTCNPLDAEKARADLEYELNNGLHKQASGMSWATFRQLFEAERLAGGKKGTRDNYRDVFNLFERICRPTPLRSVNARAVSAFYGALLREGEKGGEGMMASTVKVRLQFLKTALNWAARQKLLPELPEFPTVKVPKKR